VIDPSFIKERVVVEEMDDVSRLVDMGEAHYPRFTYAHIWLPHAPYRFNADCTWAARIDIDGNHSPNPKGSFVDQLQCANQQVIDFVDRVIKRDPSAIILINSDHGSSFDIDWSLPYDRWPASAIRQRLGNFNAMRLPSGCEPLFYDAISPVNYFELVFSCIESKKPKFLEDRIYISTFDKTHPHYGQVWRSR
jgi:hypothetical protein